MGDRSVGRVPPVPQPKMWRVRAVAPHADRYACRNRRAAAAIVIARGDPMVSRAVNAASARACSRCAMRPMTTRHPSSATPLTASMTAAEGCSRSSRSSSGRASCRPIRPSAPAAAAAAPGAALGRGHRRGEHVADEECLVVIGRIAHREPALADAAFAALETIGSPRAMTIVAAARRLRQA